MTVFLEAPHPLSQDKEVVASLSREVEGKAIREFHPGKKQGSEARPNLLKEDKAFTKGGGNFTSFYSSPDPFSCSKMSLFYLKI